MYEANVTLTDISTDDCNGIRQCVISVIQG